MKENLLTIIIFKQLESYFKEIMQYFKERKSDIRYFDMTKSLWYIKDQISDLLQNMKKAEMSFSRNLSMDKPCLLSNFTHKKLLEDIIEYSQISSFLLIYSSVKKLKEEEEKEKKYLEEIFEKAKEKKRKMKEERLRK